MDRNVFTPFTRFSQLLSAPSKSSMEATSQFSIRTQIKLGSNRIALLLKNLQNRIQITFLQRFGIGILGLVFGVCAYDSTWKGAQKKLELQSQIEISTWQNLVESRGWQALEKATLNSPVHSPVNSPAHSPENDSEKTEIYANLKHRALRAYQESPLSLRPEITSIGYVSPQTNDTQQSNIYSPLLAVVSFSSSSDHYQGQQLSLYGKRGFLESCKKKKRTLKNPSCKLEGITFYPSNPETLGNWLKVALSTDNAFKGELNDQTPVRLIKSQRNYRDSRQIIY